MKDFGGKVSVGFNNEIWVKCPDCGELSVVLTTHHSSSVHYSNYNSVFSCNHCQKTLTKSDAGFYEEYEGIVNSTCSNCNGELTYLSESKQIPEARANSFASVTCPTCGTLNSRKLYYSRFRDYKPNDPFFDFEIWMQIDIKSEIIWFMNLEHLNFIREYIASKLRPDNTRLKYSLVSNLPKFMLLAKNRDIILKRINKVEREFNEAVSQLNTTNNVT